MGVQLYEHQLKAISKLRNGCVLVGGVGSGKSRTSIAYYYTKVCKGKLRINCEGDTTPMTEPRDLYIITTAKKRDSGEWDEECIPFRLHDDINNVNVVIDSWNNIKKYVKVSNAFFIFDEQRVVGWGAWSKAFIQITRRNKWILLSATPGDNWSDYIPVFVANGFYRNKTEFNSIHAVFDRYAKFPKISRYVNTDELVRHRNDILVNMPCQRHTIPHYINVPVEYDKQLYLKVWKDRWDVYEDTPIEETGKLFYLMRKVVNSDRSRIEEVRRLLTSEHPKAIIFYNFDYELEALREMLDEENIMYGEWNGKKHEPVPDGPAWVYLVQYSAGAEGWNCITTNVIIFYSQNYSYRMTIQAAGRIDRLNTSFRDLYYYTLKSPAPIDIAIARALREKRNFNESSFKGK